MSCLLTALNVLNIEAAAAAGRGTNRLCRPGRVKEQRSTDSLIDSRPQQGVRARSGAAASSAMDVTAPAATMAPFPLLALPDLVLQHVLTFLSLLERKAVRGTSLKVRAGCCCCSAGAAAASEPQRLQQLTAPPLLPAAAAVQGGERCGAPLSRREAAWRLVPRVPAPA